MNVHAPPPARTTGHPDHLVLLQEDLSPSLDHLLRELINTGRHVTIESQRGQDASFALGDGLRLYGHAGVLNASAVGPVMECSVSQADGVFDLDITGLDNLALLSWVAVLRATQEFRARNGLLRVHAQGGVKRLVEMKTAVEPARANLEIA